MSPKRIGDFLLPPGIDIFERGWLSANNVLLYGDDDVSLVDSGYCTHQQQTVDLVAHALKQYGLVTLNKIVNTHLHSDHCGGNAAVSEAFHCDVFIPFADDLAVRSWDEDLLSYRTLGQQCPRFIHHGVLQAGQKVLLGPYQWEVLAAPGHDHHSVMFYQPEYRILISGDALWEDGFGVIFPELWGESGFGELAQTIKIIEDLKPDLVIPGHGKPFTEVSKAIANAKARLNYLAGDLQRNARHGAKVLLKFKLLEQRKMKMEIVSRWIKQTPILESVRQQLQMNATDFESWLAQALVQANAAKLENDYLVNLD
jgi:glyoxylase-like metal-dependent hydrolase (beta-lactamase superfamily II)